MIVILYKSYQIKIKYIFRDSFYIYIILNLFICNNYKFKLVNSVK